MVSSDSSIYNGAASGNPLSGANLTSPDISGGTTSGGLGNLANLSTAGTVYGIGQGLQTGGVKGDTAAALGAAGLANQVNPGLGVGTGTQVGGALGAAGGALGLINGIQQGGVSGYGGAAIGGLKAGAGVATMAGDTGLASSLGNAAGAIAIPLSLYNFASNWQSGNTSSDAIQGAEAGATIAGPWGALAGAAIGAASSAFGPGETDPEQYEANNYIDAFNAGGTKAAQAEMAQAGVSTAGLAARTKPGMSQLNDDGTNGVNAQLQKLGANATAEQAARVQGSDAAVAGANASQTFGALSGLFDMRSSDLPFYQQYGRMGEGQFMTDMTKQINSAISSGTIAKNATPEEIYNSVVNPWIGTMSNSASSTGKGWSATGTGSSGGDVGGVNDPAIQNLLTQMIGQYQSGDTFSTVGGSSVNLPQYG
jgi:hypothetical protein